MRLKSVESVALLAGAAMVLSVLLWPGWREGVAAILSIAIGVATVIYAVLTSRLLESQTRPHVVVYMRQDDFIVYLAVENYGSGEARKISFEVVGDFNRFPDEHASDAGFLTDGIEQLAPGQRREVLLANAAGTITEPWPSVVVKVRYQSVEGSRYGAEFLLRLADFKNASLIRPPTAKLLERLEKIERSLDRIREAMDRRQ